MVDGLPALRSDADNVVPYPDQALFLALRGAGQGAVMQAIWIYDRPVDLEAIRRFHRNLHSGLLARLIETSPLPFGRHRWVCAPSAQSNLDIAERPRPREELFDWADEQVDMPLDPEWGPGWRLGIQPLTDGSTVVALVISHCIADGAGSVMACIEAINDSRRDLGYPPPGSRTRLQALRQDFRQLGTDIPDVARTVARAAKVALGRRRELSHPAPASIGAAAGDSTPHVPSAAVFIPTGDWDGCAERLGGNNFSLAAGFAARLAANLKRTRASDGVVTLMIPVSERQTLEDTGGNMVSIARVGIDPAGVTKDLTAPRTAIREGLRTAREAPDEVMELLPLIPFLPKRGFARLADAAFGFSTDLPVACSNLGDLPPDLLRVDGTPAQYLCFRGVDRKVSRESLDRRGGILTVASGRLAGNTILTVISYQPGGPNTHEHLREVISQTLNEFGLDGAIL